MTKRELLAASTCCTSDKGTISGDCPLKKDPDCIQTMLLAIRDQLCAEVDA